MSIFFDENGFLNLDEAVLETPSFKSIMADGIVTDDELSDQAKLETSLFHDIEDTCTPQQAGLVKKLLAEMSVLFAVYHYKELQSLK